MARFRFAAWCSVVGSLGLLRLAAVVALLARAVDAEFGAVALGVAEALALYLGMVNCRAMRSRDEGLTAPVVPLCYVTMALVVAPLGPCLFGSGWAWWLIQWCLTFQAVAVVWVRWWLWRSYTLGPSTWVALVDR